MLRISSPPRSSNRNSTLVGFGRPLQLLLLVHAMKKDEDVRQRESSQDVAIGRSRPTVFGTEISVFLAH
jgi:hypothetical protein